MLTTYIYLLELLSLIINFYAAIDLYGFWTRQTKNIFECLVIFLMGAKKGRDRFGI